VNDNQFTSFEDEDFDLDLADDYIAWLEYRVDEHGDTIMSCSCGRELNFELAGRRTVLVTCPRGCDGAADDPRFPATRVRLVSPKKLRISRGTHLRSVHPALKALRSIEGNDPKTFIRSGKLVMVKDGGIEPITATDLRIRIAEGATFENEHGDTVDPPVELARLALSTSDLPFFPEIDRVDSVPTMRPGGSFQVERGYDSKTKTFYAPAGELRGLVVPQSVTRSEMEKARALVLGVVGDFPFVSTADRANALSMMFTPFVRDLIAGPTPMHWIGAPEPGTGKGVLVTTCLAPAFGLVASRVFPEQENERRKAITAALIEGVGAIKWDNVKGVVRSAALEAALTEARWSDRRLGSSTNLDLPVSQVWTLTANNATPGTDLKRRTVAIRLDAGVELPYRRSGPREGRSWRYTLPAWALEHRAELVEAVLMLLRWWTQEGMTLGDTGRMGSYESWEGVIGGVLAAVEIEGFLANVDELDASEDEERDELAEFLHAWRLDFGDSERTSREVAEACENEPACTAHVRRYVGRTASEVGAALRQRRNRVSGGMRLVRVERRHASSAWRVEVL
jgi:hypothetical protein